MYDRSASGRYWAWSLIRWIMGNENHLIRPCTLLGEHLPSPYRVNRLYKHLSQHITTMLELSVKWSQSSRSYLNHRRNISSKEGERMQDRINEMWNVGFWYCQARWRRIGQVLRWSELAGKCGFLVPQTPDDRGIFRQKLSDCEGQQICVWSHWLSSRNIEQLPL